MADAVGTVVGACLGTSTVTSYVESSAGVAAGGRTGLTAVTTAVLFFISLIFAPIFTSIPSFATTPAMLYVGLLMLSSIRQVKFDGDIADAIGAFLAIIMMPLTYSIANGIMFGIVSWVILKLVTGKAKDISAVMWISVVLFAIKALLFHITFLYIHSAYYSYTKNYRHRQKHCRPSQTDFKSFIIHNYPCVLSL